MRMPRALKWAAFAAGGILGLFVLIGLVGLMLPERHIATVSTTLAVPADSVWAVIRSFGEYDSWWPDVKTVERRSTGSEREVWVQRGRGGPLPIEVIESQAPHRLVTRIADSNLPFGGTWTYEITETPTGTQLTVTEDGAVYNPIFRFVSRLVISHYATLESYLRALGQRFGADVNLTRLTES